MKYLGKFWLFITKYIVKYYVAFFVGCVTWMLVDVYVTKGIDASFVSAFMNTIMAVIAFVALIKVKQIWEVRLSEESYNSAKSIFLTIRKNDLFFDLLMLNLKNIERHVELYTNDNQVGNDYFLSDITVSPKELDIISKAGYFLLIFEGAKSLATDLSPQLKKHFEIIQGDLLNFKLAGGSVIENTAIELYIKNLSGVDECMKEFFNELQNVYSKVNVSIFDINSNIEYNDKVNTYTNYNIDFSIIKKKLKSLIYYMDLLSNDSDELNCVDSKITSYFRLKI